MKLHLPTDSNLNGYQKLCKIRDLVSDTFGNNYGYYIINNEELSLNEELFFNERDPENSGLIGFLGNLVNDGISEVDVEYLKDKTEKSEIAYLKEKEKLHKFFKDIASTKEFQEGLREILNN